MDAAGICPPLLANGQADYHSMWLRVWALPGEGANWQRRVAAPMEAPSSCARWQRQVAAPSGSAERQRRVAAPTGSARWQHLLAAPSGSAWLQHWVAAPSGSAEWQRPVAAPSASAKLAALSGSAHWQSRRGGRPTQELAGNNPRTGNPRSALRNEAPPEGGSQGAPGSTWTSCEPGGSQMPGGRVPYLG